MAMLREGKTFRSLGPRLDESESGAETTKSLTFS